MNAVCEVQLNNHPMRLSAASPLQMQREAELPTRAPQKLFEHVALVGYNECVPELEQILLDHALVRLAHQKDSNAFELRKERCGKLIVHDSDSFNEIL